MQLKTFSAHSMPAALNLIREELGPDAVILDTQEEDGTVTITAALERAPTGGSGQSAKTGRDGQDEPSSGFQPIGGGKPSRYAVSALGGVYPGVAEPQGGGRWDSSAGFKDYAGEDSVHDFSAERAAFPEDSGEAGPALSGPSGRAARKKRASAEAEGAQLNGQGAAFYGGQAGPVPPGWQQWHAEWNDIKHHLLTLMKPALRLEELPPRQRLAVEFLQREGVEDEAMIGLVQKLQSDPEASILGPLAEMVPMRPWGEEEWPQRIQIVTGPFGAGKTSVAIRMALNLRRKSPSCRICLVNADATRGNGRLLLRHYCELSDLAYKEASTTLELVAALNAATKEGFERIIVDLPGLSRGRYLTTLLSDAGLGERTGERPEDAAVHITISPHYGSIQLKGILSRYRTEHVGGLVWTKLDEAEHYGQIVNVGTASRLPISALSFGPGLGSSLAPVRENMLWRLIFKRELPIGS